MLHCRLSLFPASKRPEGGLCHPQEQNRRILRIATHPLGLLDCLGRLFMPSTSLSLVPHVGYPWSPVGRFLHPHSHHNHLVAPSLALPIGLLMRRSLLPALSVYPSQSPVAPAPCKTPVVSEHFECIPYIGVGTAIGGHNQVDPATTSHTSVTLVS